jgi:hypothetical protein
LDRRYFTFAASLPLPLDRMARDRQIFTGKGISLELKSLAEIHPLVTCLPWLFQEAFPTVLPEDVLHIAEAGMLLSMGMLLHDAYQDNQLNSRPGISLLYVQLIVAAMRKLHELFDAHSLFWSYLDQYFHEYTEALILEKEHWGKVEIYPLELMYKIGCGKVALLKAVVAALAIKGQAEKHLKQLERTIDLLTAAMQLGDDIGDWAEDYQHQNYTLPLTFVIPTEHWPKPNLSVEDVGQCFDNSIILEKLIVQAIEWFQAARTAVEELNCRHWVVFVEGCLRMSRRYQESFVARKLLKVINPRLSNK